jgi:hypothetical protein
VAYSCENGSEPPGSIEGSAQGLSASQAYVSSMDLVVNTTRQTSCSSLFIRGIPFLYSSFFLTLQSFQTSSGYSKIFHCFSSLSAYECQDSTLK